MVWKAAHIGPGAARRATSKADPYAQNAALYSGFRRNPALRGRAADPRPR
ncbi:hypothetical protein Lokhon_00143 (plasmid) [Limimaricola hongkongensis DSM 17492]|uniref:Uncharacterized protein n=1 Tax=Limimaricola hongkongensis DSM 17492 TaxID=1122180 RepID=A0A017H9B8_9RHOB|nr:hypothetical protein Lokhon_00143 [Limimaricola hongkongensis DSM 17492]